MAKLINQHLTVASSTADVMKWILANEHHRGWWTGPMEARTSFYLEGETARLRIPAAIHRPGMMRGADYEKTKRMYEPTDAGRAALQSSEASS